MITSTTQMLADFMLSHEAEFAESITDFDYLEQFAVVLAVNYNLRNGKPHPITEGCRAVFMTASEIHAKLKMWGNITTPMPLNKFGELLKRRGYVRKKLHGICGYIVQQIDNQSDRKHDDIMEIIKGAGRVSTF